MSTTQRQASRGNGKIIETAKKTMFSTSNPFEQKFGYYRAVKRGPLVWISGTTAVQFDEDKTGTKAISEPWYPEGAKAQSEMAMKRCIEALRELGGNLEDVVRVRMFVANFDDCGAVGEAFRKCFGTQPDADNQPAVDEDIVGSAATMIVVPGGFVDKSMLVEVEVDAYCI